MSEIYVFIIRFEDRAAIDRAFQEVLAMPGIDVCSVEPDALRVRFLSSQRKGTAFVERVYERGGMTWCERYPVRPAASALRSARSTTRTATTLLRH